MSSLTRRQLLRIGRQHPIGSSFEVRAPSINPRSAWADDRPARGPLPVEEVRFLIVHHSASNNGHTSADAPRILRGFYDFHTSESRGWNDVAYNFLIDADGGVWEGRAGSLEGPVAGDATGGNQGFTQLVCLIGNFDERAPSDAALASLVETLAWLADRYEISTKPGAEVTFTSRGSNRHATGSEVTTPTITGHRTMSQTSCPGDHLNEYVVGSLMADVERLRVSAITTTTAPITTTTTSTTTTSTTVPSTTTVPTTTSTSPTEPEVPMSTTLPAAAEPAEPSFAGWAGALAAIVVALGGLLFWRQRRMTN